MVSRKKVQYLIVHMHATFLLMMMVWEFAIWHKKKSVTNYSMIYIEIYVYFKYILSNDCPDN